MAAYGSVGVVYPAANWAIYPKGAAVASAHHLKKEMLQEPSQSPPVPSPPCETRRSGYLLIVPGFRVSPPKSMIVSKNYTGGVEEEGKGAADPQGSAVRYANLRGVWNGDPAVHGRHQLRQE